MPSSYPGPVGTEFIARAEGAHPGEDHGEWRLAPGIDPDRGVGQVLAGLNASVPRTVSLPRMAGVARLGRAAVVHRGRWRSW